MAPKYRLRTMRQNSAAEHRLKLNHRAAAVEALRHRRQRMPDARAIGSGITLGRPRSGCRLRHVDDAAGAVGDWPRGTVAQRMRESESERRRCTRITAATPSQISRFVQQHAGHRHEPRVLFGDRPVLRERRLRSQTERIDEPGELLVLDVVEQVAGDEIADRSRIAPPA